MESFVTSNFKSEMKRQYGEVARTVVESSDCCGGDRWYTTDELRMLPKGAYLGEGSGNPAASANLKRGERVLDLGSGAGVDVFLASQKVGPTGRVVGIDLTPEMVERATKLARDAGYGNVEFRLGDMESLPFPDSSFDAVISNCVINLAEDRREVFREVFRVLKPGGRLAISDIVRQSQARTASGAHAECGSCATRAVTQSEYEKAIKDAGFKEVTTLTQNQDSCCIPGQRVFAGATILGTKL